MNHPADYDAARACQLFLDRLQMGDAPASLVAVAEDAERKLRAFIDRGAG